MVIIIETVAIIVMTAHSVCMYVYTSVINSSLLLSGILCGTVNTVRGWSSYATGCFSLYSRTSLIWTSWDQRLFRYQSSNYHNYAYTCNSSSEYLMWISAKSPWVYWGGWTTNAHTQTDIYVYFTDEIASLVSGYIHSVYCSCLEGFFLGGGGWGNSLSAVNWPLPGKENLHVYPCVLV